MGYKEKYNTALEKLQEALAPCEDGCKISGLTRGCLENIFPELKENEDERIRKGLCKAIWTYIPYEDAQKYITWLEKQGDPKDKGEVSDGYHTFNELYRYRMLYNAAFFNLLPKELVHKSKRHHDGEECFGGGWFIVMANLSTGQISNHYELKDWDLFQIPERDVADEWDGHTPQEAADRLYKYLLEKQDEQLVEPKWCHHKVDLSDCSEEYRKAYYDSWNNCNMQYSQREAKSHNDDERIIKEIIDFLRLPHPQFVGKRDHEKWISWLEKHGKQNPVEWSEEDEKIKESIKKHIFNADHWYVSKVDGKIHNMTYNPADKVEPKFKVGDFIANDYCSGKVIEITNDAYLLDTGQGIPFSCEHNAHLWTIEDAKDGDVLATDVSVFIYAKVLYNKPYAYCVVDKFGVFKDNFLENDWSNSVDNIHPATKEQRDLLFQKMKEEGCEWDSKKKEFKKIEVKTLNADKVIKWLKNNGWCTVGGPKVEIAQINKFKKDFGL